MSFGTETDGSIVCPGNANGVVALKPTVGLISRAGVVPISHTQDTVGPHGRTVADFAVALGVVQSRTFDGRDPATGDVPLGWEGRARPTNIPYGLYPIPQPEGAEGARIGITRVGLNGFDSVTTPQPVLEAIEASFQALKDAGANVIDLDARGFVFPPADGEFFILLYDFKGDIAKYFKTRVGVPVARAEIFGARSNSTMLMPTSKCHSSTRTFSILRKLSCSILTGLIQTSVFPTTRLSISIKTQV